MDGNVKIFGGRSNAALFTSICNSLNRAPGKISLGNFSDGEITVEINESVRQADVFVVQSLCNSSDILELILIADAMRRASVKSLTAVIPYFGYARQERKGKKRNPISAKRVAKMIEEAGFNSILVAELHAGAIQGFVDCPMDHLYTSPLLIKEAIRPLELNPAESVIVSPDAGGFDRANYYAEKLGFGLAMTYKRRPKPNEAKIFAFLSQDDHGDVNGRDVVMVDDMIDTAGTACNIAGVAKQKGARRVYAVATHGVFSGATVMNITNSAFDGVIVTNTISPKPEVIACPKIRYVDAGPFLAQAIQNIYLGESLAAFREP